MALPPDPLARPLSWSSHAQATLLARVRKIFEVAEDAELQAEVEASLASLDQPGTPRQLALWRDAPSPPTLDELTQAWATGDWVVLQAQLDAQLTP